MFQVSTNSLQQNTRFLKPYKGLQSSQSKHEPLKKSLWSAMLLVSTPIINRWRPLTVINPQKLSSENSSELLVLFELLVIPGKSC